MKDKIKLFMESEVILSSNSGALTLIFCCHPTTKVIEIRNIGSYGFQHEHYLEICKIAGVPYYNYRDINEDSNGNFVLNFDTFEPYLQNVIQEPLNG